jgi:hypothetical protein
MEEFFFQANGWKGLDLIKRSKILGYLFTVAPS